MKITVHLGGNEKNFNSTNDLNTASPFAILIQDYKKRDKSFLKSCRLAKIFLNHLNKQLV